ncbi:hypothetical protein P8452_77202 [Trifolium repens]|nr:hypothetical protein P8452_77202 [Trifolium repens]
MNVSSGSPDGYKPQLLAQQLLPIVVAPLIATVASPNRRSGEDIMETDLLSHRSELIFHFPDVAKEKDWAKGALLASGLPYFCHPIYLTEGDVLSFYMVWNNKETMTKQGGDGGASPLWRICSIVVLWNWINLGS